MKVNFRQTAVLATSMLAVASGSARALTIHTVFDTSITSQAKAATIEAAFNRVAADYAKSFANPVTVNVAVSWGKVGGQALPASAVGASIDNLYGSYSYAQVKNDLSKALAAQPSDTALATAMAHLPTAAPAGVGAYWVPSSEAKALGLIPGSQSAVDGYIGFAGTPANFSFSSTIAAGTYDFEAVAAHELDEVLGRISGLSSTSPTYRTPFDLFRYSAPGAMSYSYNASAYFSIDGGLTALASFNHSSSGGDRADWLTTSATNDIQDAFLYAGRHANLTAVDLTGLDVLGWGGGNLGDTAVATPGAVAFNLVQAPAAVPEAPTWLMLIAGFSVMGQALRSQNRQVAVARLARKVG
jgi:hypothetical protein